MKGVQLVNDVTKYPIDADRLITVLKSTTAISQSNYDLFNHIVGLIEHQPTVIEASA